MSKEQNSHIFIEEMNGFLPIVESLDQTESHHFEYGNQEDFLDLLQHGQQIVGLVKGPRSKITPQMLERMSRALADPVIAYIGRHPGKILDKDVNFLSKMTNGKKVFYLQTRFGEIPLLPIGRSPLSSAVAAFIFSMTQSILYGNSSNINYLTMAGGNTFDHRIGHNFTTRTESESFFTDYLVGVIGAGEIGSLVMDSFHAAGAQISYAECGKISLPYVAECTGTIEGLLDLLANTKKKTILTSHLPSGVTIPLDQANNVDLFINAASGSNIDETELIRALDEGRIQHAIIDVFSHEGKIFQQSLLRQHLNDPRLTLTPHIAYNEPSAIRDTLKLAVGHITTFSEQQKEEKHAK